MTLEIVLCLLFGHLLGDYFFQNHWMVSNKKEQNLPCFIHCLIYTIIVILCLYGIFFPLSIITILGMIGIFLSHWVFDRLHIVDRWVKFFNKIDTPEEFARKMGLSKITSPGVMIQKCMVGWIIRIVVDNTLHLVLMYWILKGVLIWK